MIRTIVITTIVSSYVSICYVGAYGMNVANSYINERKGKWTIAAYLVFLFAPVAVPLVIATAIAFGIKEVITGKPVIALKEPPPVEVEFPEGLCVQCQQPIPAGVFIGALNLKFDKRECLQKYLETHREDQS